MLGAEVKEHYLEFAPSNAVDGDPETAFLSLYGMLPLFLVLYRTHAENHVDANAGDYVAIGWHNGFTSAEITFVVDKTTENLLSQAHFTTSIGSASVVRPKESPR